MKLLNRAGIAALVWLAFSPARAAGLEVSQFAYRAADLLVFVQASDPAAWSPATSGSMATMALGTRGLTVKSFHAGTPADGVAVVVAVDVSGSMKSVDFPLVSRAVAQALASLPAPSRAG